MTGNGMVGLRPRMTYVCVFSGPKLALLLMLFGCGGGGPARPPNVLIVEAQGIGLSDVGAYGSEIHTPHLDSLARRGLRFTEFYGELMDGGVVSGDTSRCAILDLPEWRAGGAMGAAGYELYEAGASPRGRSEPQSTVATREALAQLAEHARRDPRAPFLLHITYSPPSPQTHPALPETRQYAGRYVAGWQVLRRERFARMLALGIVDDRYILPPIDSATTQTGNSVADASWMERYAALVERMDHDVGRLLAGLRATVSDRNTLVLFIATNRPAGRRGDTAEAPVGWLHASSTPFRRHPGGLFEGTLKRPLIAYWPEGITQPGELTRHVSHARDIAATIMAVAGISPTALTMRGDACGRIGTSLVDAFRGSVDATQDTLYWATDGGGAIRLGQWKLVALQGPPERWMLFDLSVDPTETRDLAADAGERVAHMRTTWHAWAAQKTNLR